MTSKKTIKKVQFGQFEVRVSEKQVVFQTLNKDWSTVYGNNMTPYSVVIALMEQEHEDILHTYALALYNQTLFFSDATLVTDFFDSIQRFADRKELPEDDAEILEEEKIMETLRQEEQ